MAKRMPTQTQEDHIIFGSCPFCGSESVTGDSIDSGICREGSTDRWAEQEMTCDECEGVWYDWYKLVEYVAVVPEESPNTD